MLRTGEVSQGNGIIGRLMLVGLIVFVALQVFRPGIPAQACHG